MELDESAYVTFQTHRTALRSLKPVQLSFPQSQCKKLW
jgi:hypothetical protein